MGLDMYLQGRKYLPRNWDKPELNRTEDGFDLEEVTLRLGYWRKHPNLHGHIVQTYGPRDEGGEAIDNCQPIDLDATAMRQIITVIEGDALPHTDGFFFGRSYLPGDKDHAKEKADAIETFKKAIAWLETKDSASWRSVQYLASW